MEFFFFWFALSIAVAWFASTRGRGGVGWFILSLVISPLLGFIFCALAPDMKKEAAERQAIAESKKCPQCAELVKAEAKICRFCGYRFEPDAGARAISA